MDRWWRSGPGPPSAYGETTVAPGARGTPAASGKPASTVANSSSMAATTSGSSTPWSARKTMVPDWPPVPSSGKWSSSTAKPAALSEPGTAEPLPNDGPTMPAAANTRTRVTTHRPTAARRWSKHQPPTRPRTVSLVGGR